jgi:peptide/nickel transport system substrate-binding protein
MKSRRLLALLGCLLGVVLLAALVAGCGEKTTTTTAQSATSSSAVTGSTGGTTTPTEAGIARSVLQCPQGPASDAAPQYGGTLVLLHYAAPTNLGAFWLQTGFTDVQMSRYAVENLVGLDDKGNPVAQLATSWDIDEAAMTITFHLREGVKFHDGTDFNADAVKWNLDKWRSESDKTDLAKVTDIVVVDPYTVRVAFSAWDPLWLQGLNSGGAGKIVSPTAVEAMGAEKAMLNPVGTGPFKFVEYKTARSLKFEKWEGYWQEGLPYLDGVEIRFMGDSMAALMALQNGEADALYGVSPANAKGLLGNGFTVDTRVFAVWSIAGDSKSDTSPFSDQKVREGMAYALDVDAIVKGVYGDFMFPTQQLAAEGMQAYNPNIVGHPYDVAKAKQLLAESKFNISPANPWNVRFTYIIQAGDESQVMTVIQDYLKEVGINLELNGQSFPAQKAMAENGFKNELILGDISYNGLEMQYSTALSANFSEDAVTFVDIWIPEEFNAVYRTMKVEPDLAKRETMYQELNKIAVDDFCLVVPFMVNEGLVAKSAAVHDYDFGNTTVGEFLPERAWLSK